MNFAKVFQLDMGHQVLMQIVDLPILPPLTCIEYTTAIEGCIVSVPVGYKDEDEMNRYFDKADEEFARAVFRELVEEYRSMTGRGGSDDE